MNCRLEVCPLVRMVISVVISESPLLLRRLQRFSQHLMVSGIRPRFNRVVGRVRGSARFAWGQKRLRSVNRVESSGSRFRRPASSSEPSRGSRSFSFSTRPTVVPPRYSPSRASVCATFFYPGTGADNLQSTDDVVYEVGELVHRFEDLVKHSGSRSVLVTTRPASDH